MSKMNGMKKLKQKKNESDNDFSNRKARHDSRVREQEKNEHDRALASRIASDEVPPHIAALRRVFGKK